MSNDQLTLALLGFGTVGRGVYDILQNNRDYFKKRTGLELSVKWVLVRDIKKVNVAQASFQVTPSFSDIVEDPDVDVVVEVMGGMDPALGYVEESLKKGKRVVTANKDMISAHKESLFLLAKEHHTDIFFEASVAGGIPIIRTLKVGLASNQISSFYGILNGTTNFILSKMDIDGMKYEEALQIAQDKGFAEADPTKDVSGEDAAHKLVILTAIAFKELVSIEDIHFEGITQIADKDMDYARKMGYTIKLLSIGRKRPDGKLVLKVHPTLIPIDHPLAPIHNEFNAVHIYGDAVGDILLSGKGAGGLPTGSAVVSDIIDIALSHGYDVSKHNLEPHLTPSKPIPLCDTQSQFYLRLLVDDHPGALEKISGVLRKQNVSISKILQYASIENSAEVVIVTHLVQEKLIDSAVSQLEQDVDKLRIVAKIRVGLDEILTA